MGSDARGAQTFVTVTSAPCLSARLYGQNCRATHQRRATVHGKENTHIMRRRDDRVVVAPLDIDLDAQAKAVDVRLHGVAEEDAGGDLRVLRHLHLVRARGSELQCAEEASCGSAR